MCQITQSTQKCKQPVFRNRQDFSGRDVTTIKSPPTVLKAPAEWMQTQSGRSLLRPVTADQSELTRF